MTCSWVWAKNVWHDAQTVFCVQWNSVGNLNLLGKINVFLSIPHIMRTFSLTSNGTCRVVKLAFIISSRTFWGKRCLNETVFRFSPIFDSEQKTLGRVFTSASSVSREMFWKKKHNFELYSIFFSLAQWIPVDLRTTIYVARRTFWDTFVWKIGFLSWFSDFEQKSCKTFR